MGFEKNTTFILLGILILSIISPAYAEVTSFQLDEIFYIKGDQISYSGTVDTESSGPRTFVIEWARSGKTGPVALSASLARAAADTTDGAIPLVAVPHMGEVGRRLCDEAGVAWLDLSGNAHIIAEGLRVVISGRPNRFQTEWKPFFASKPGKCWRW